MKELLQQAVGNELIHCQKLSMKTKHTPPIPPHPAPPPQKKKKERKKTKV